MGVNGIAEPTGVFLTIHLALGTVPCLVFVYFSLWLLQPLSVRVLRVFADVVMSALIVFVAILALVRRRHQPLSNRNVGLLLMSMLTLVADVLLQQVPFGSYCVYVSSSLVLSHCSFSFVPFGAYSV